MRTYRGQRELGQAHEAKDIGLELAADLLRRGLLYRTHAEVNAARNILRPGLALRHEREAA